MDSIKYYWSPKKPTIFFDPASTNAQKILSDLPLNVVDSPLQADLIWVREHYQNILPGIKPFQAINYIPAEEIMTRKGDLTKSLRDYDDTHPAESALYRNFYQETYRLSDPQERAAFLRQLPQKDNPNNLWIMKPSALSQGEGIKILWQFKELKKELSDPKKNTLEYNNQQLEYIIQRYIKNVLLLEEKKSEIRIYWLIASLNPLLVLMYKEGTTRLTTLPYKLDDFDNPLIHITNIHQQKKNKTSQENAVLKWDFAQLQAYLSAERFLPPTFIKDQLKPQLKQCLAYVVRATIDSLKRTPVPGMFFGLYGADFILDDNLTPWLAEIQRGPGLSCDDPIKQRIIPPMVQETVQIVLEIQRRKQNFDTLTNLSSVKNYEWLIK